METIVVNGIVLCAVLFLARWLYKNMVAKKNEPACGSCESCAPEDTVAAAHASDAAAPSASTND